MKKIMIVMSAIDVGGAQRFCLNLAMYLSSIDYDYQVVFLRKGKSKELREEFVQHKIKFEELKCESVTSSLPKLISILHKERPDIILSSVGNVDFITSVARIFTPCSKLLLRKANVIFDNQRRWTNRLKLKFESLVCTKMIALTNEMREDYIQYGFTLNKSIVINNMIDMNYIKKRCREEHEIFPWFSMGQGKILIANARMVPEKRYDILIVAFRIVRNEFPDTKLIILGDGKLREDIEKKISPDLRDNVALLGFQNNPYYYLMNSDIFVLTSDYEGFPNVLIEAMACGLPVVSTNSKTGPKEIVKDGFDGYVVPRGDAKALAESIMKLISNDNLTDEFSKNAIGESKRYSVEYIAKQYVELFEDL